MISTSRKLQSAINRLMDVNENAWDLLEDEADASCLTSYSNDYATGYDIFMSGFNFAILANRKEVWEVEDDLDPATVYFFVGTEAEVLKRIEALR